MDLGTDLDFRGQVGCLVFRFPDSWEGPGRAAFHIFREQQALPVSDPLSLSQVHRNPTGETQCWGRLLRPIRARDHRLLWGFLR